MAKYSQLDKIGKTVRQVICKINAIVQKKVFREFFFFFARVIKLKPPLFPDGLGHLDSISALAAFQPKSLYVLLLWVVFFFF